MVKLPIGILAILSFAMFHASAVAKESVMKSPPPVMDLQNEVSPTDGDSARCTALIRASSIVKQPGVVTSSERVSYSNEFGHILRYEMMGPVGDKDKSIDRARFTLVIWSKDCMTMRFVTYPVFDLPK